MQYIQTVEQFNELIEKNETVFFLKHSNTCNISENAYEAYEAFTANNDVVAAYLVVQEDRPLSNHIAETYGIQHHSPQLFKFVNGQVDFHTSHRNITVDELLKQL